MKFQLRTAMPRKITILNICSIAFQKIVHHDMPLSSVISAYFLNADHEMEPIEQTEYDRWHKSGIVKEHHKAKFAPVQERSVQCQISHHEHKVHNSKNKWEVNHSEEEYEVHTFKFVYFEVLHCGNWQQAVAHHWYHQHYDHRHYGFVSLHLVWIRGPVLPRSWRIACLHFAFISINYVI